MESALSRIRGHVAWILFYGPALSFLPARWRGRKLNQKFALWELATIISGFTEFLAGMIMIMVGTFLPSQVSPVLLWIAVYVFCDGAWRTVHVKVHGETAGTALLMLLDKAVHDARQSAWGMLHPVVSDLATLDDAREDWQLKIEAARPKRNWEAGKIVHFGERYFRIEASVQTDSGRPFVYLLRSLPAGVPGHGVLTYTPVGISPRPS